MSAKRCSEILDITNNRILMVEKRSSIPQSVVLVGGGGHARACIDVIERQGNYSVAGIVDPTKPVNSHLSAYPYLGPDLVLNKLMAEYPHALVTVGQVGNASTRKRIFDDLVRLGYCLATIVSPWAYVSPEASLSEGTIVFHGAIINSSSKIGKNCIINTRSLVEHDVEVGDHTHISTGAILNGGVSVGHGTFVGSGATIRDKISIGNECFVGMGCVVKASLADGERLV